MTVKEAIENALSVLEALHGRSSPAYRNLAAAYDALVDQPDVMQKEIK